MYFLGFLLYLSYAIAASNALEINCNYQTNSWTHHGLLRECIVYGVVSTAPGDQISNSAPDKGVESFYIYQSPSLYYVPSGIADHFVDIKVLIIAFTGLKEITQDDLRPLKMLQNLYLDNNHLESIEKDLFAYNPLIEHLNLGQNRIKVVAFNVLDPLVNLEEISFEHNDCINFKAVNENELDQLKTLLKLHCSPPSFEPELSNSTLDYEYDVLSNDSYVEQDDDHNFMSTSSAPAIRSVLTFIFKVNIDHLSF